MFYLFDYYIVYFMIYKKSAFYTFSHLKRECFISFSDVLVASISISLSLSINLIYNMFHLIQ